MVGSRTGELGAIRGSGDLLAFYLPLAASGLLMTLQQPVVNAGVARTYDPTVQLAAYGVLLSLVVLLESPIQMLLQTATALVRDDHSFRLVRRLMLLAGLGLSGLGLLLYASPISILVTDGILGLPPQVGAATRGALWVMLPWPLAVAWRRFYQGVLIGAGKTGVVGWATLCRLLAIGLTMVIGLTQATSLPGALLGGLALSVGAIAEAALVTLWARPVVQGSIHYRSQPANPSLTFATLLSFYAPLAATSVMTVAAWPTISSALARAPQATVSLGAWPIALSIWWILGTPLQMLQQVVIAALKDGRPRPMVRRFVLLCGTSASVLLAAASLSPLLGIFVTDVIGARPDLTEAVVAAARAMTPLPILAALQALLQGKLIVVGLTRRVRAAMAANFAVLVAVLLLGIAWTAMEGAVLAATGLVVSASVEVAVLYYFAEATGGGAPTKYA